MELRGLNSTCNSAVNNLHIAVKHLDELMEKMQTRLHSPIENINFINAMNAAKSATNNLLIDLQQLKLELVVDQI
nr:unnamed protein product [Fasciola hepatica]